MEKLYQSFDNGKKKTKKKEGNTDTFNMANYRKFDPISSFNR